MSLRGITAPRARKLAAGRNTSLELHMMSSSAGQSGGTPAQHLSGGHGMACFQAACMEEMAGTLDVWLLYQFDSYVHFRGCTMCNVCLPVKRNFIACIVFSTLKFSKVAVHTKLVILSSHHRLFRNVSQPFDSQLSTPPHPHTPPHPPALKSIPYS